MPFDGFCFNCKFKLTFHSDFKFNFYQGFVKAIIGPSLLDLQEIVNADESALFFIFISCSAGYLSGSILAGLSYNWFNSQILIILLLVIQGAFFIAAPWNTGIIGLSICIFFMNFASGGIDTGGNVRCLGLWGQYCAPFL